MDCKETTAQSGTQNIYDPEDDLHGERSCNFGRTIEAETDSYRGTESRAQRRPAIGRKPPQQRHSALTEKSSHGTSIASVIIRLFASLVILLP